MVNYSVQSIDISGERTKSNYLVGMVAEDLIAEKGLTLIWPTDFTHTHSGQISKTHEKYIITGWFNFK